MANDIPIMYEITKQKKWSDIIKRKRLTWFGHLARLPDQTPARRALDYALTPYKRSVGRPKMIWVNLIKEQLKETLDLNYFEDYELAQDRT